MHRARSLPARLRPYPPAWRRGGRSMSLLVRRSRYLRGAPSGPVLSGVTIASPECCGCSAIREEKLGQASNLRQGLRIGLWQNGNPWVTPEGKRNLFRGSRLQACFDRLRTGLEGWAGRDNFVSSSGQYFGLPASRGAFRRPDAGAGACRCNAGRSRARGGGRGPCRPSPPLPSP